MIARRTFLRAGALLALPSQAIAQPKDKLRRIGYLSAFPRSDTDPLYNSLRLELARLGWIDGRTVTLLELRSSEGRNDRLPNLAAEVVQLAPELILVQSAPATRALMQATTTIPIVMIAVGDPVLYGIVRSYTEPGGNVTGTSYLINEASRKTLELLKEIAPRIASVATFTNPTNEGAESWIKEMQAAAKALGVRIHLLDVRTAADFEPGFAAIHRLGAESLLLPPEPLIRSQRAAIGRFAAEHRLPLAIVGAARFLDAGGLLTYGASFDQYPALTARYVDKILRGANPAKLAIAQPTKFDLGISLASAKALGLEVSASLLARADEVIR
jgi:putative tryptophan/tyrosine transport system substrate-binding protein